MEPSHVLEGIPLVSISPDGIFKYILIQVFIAGKMAGYVVRGSTKHEYHNENYQAFMKELENLGFEAVKQPNMDKKREVTAKKGGVSYKFICEGGGRI